MKYRIVHKTAYKYSEPASLSQNELILEPRDTAFQRVGQAHLSILPEPQYSSSRIDFFGNRVQVFMVQHPHTELTMTATSQVETISPGDPAPQQTLPWENTVQTLCGHSQVEALDAFQFVFASPMITIGPRMRDYALLSFPPGRPVARRRCGSDGTYFQ